MAAIEFPEEHVVVDLEKPPPSAPSTAEVPADFDPASHMARQLLDIEEAKYRSAEQATRHANYVQGQALMRISELELYKVRGFRSFKDYVELHLKLDAATAHIMISVARAYTPEQIEQVSFSVARAGLRLLNATPEQDTVNDLFGMVLHFDDGTRVRFIDATLRQVDEFIRQVKRRQTKTAPIENPGFERIIDMSENLKRAAASVDLKMVVSTPESMPADAPEPEAPGKLKVDVTIRRAPMDELPELFESLAAAARRSRDGSNG